jgi:hypothetical protein
MANMVIPNVGKLLWLEWALTGDGTTYEAVVVELYQSDTTPDADSVVTDFDVCDFTGYDIVVFARADFTTPAVVDDIAQTTGAPPPEYTCTGGSPQDAYGWIMYGQESETLLAAQRFDTVRSMAPGATEKLDPFTISLDQIA